MPVDNHNADGEDSSIHGEFDADKPESVLESIKASKGTTRLRPRAIVSTSTGNSGSARYIQLTPAAPAVDNVSVARHTAQVHICLLFYLLLAKFIQDACQAYDDHVPSGTYSESSYSGTYSGYCPSGAYSSYSE